MWRGLVILLALIPAYAAPQISKVEPLAVVPGKRTTLTFSGSGLDSISNLWTSFPSEAKRVATTNAGKVSFSILCPPGASGVQAVQLIGADGASEFQLILVDHLRTTEASDNGSIEKALKVEPPIAVDAALKSEQIDYYKFSAKAGQSFSIEVIAHRIGSQTDPVVRVLSKNGDELAFCDDEGGVWKDARFRFVAPLTDEYILAVHDIGYGGGNNYEYRLRVSDDALVWFTFPLMDAAETGARFEAIGATRGDAKQTSPANPPAVASFPMTPQLVEAEPNDEREQAQSIIEGVQLNGKIETGGDLDFFRFEVEKDQRLIFQSQTRSLGSPCDLVLRILKLDGGVEASSDSGSTQDAAVTNRFEKAGKYFLEVRELTGAAVTNAPYRIAVRDFEPGFELRSESNIIAVKAGESAKFKVQATRYDYSGPIELKLTPHVEGIALENASIPEKKNEVEVTLKATEKLDPGFFAHIGIVAQSTNGASVKLSTVPALRKTFPLILHPPRMLDGIVTLVVREK